VPPPSGRPHRTDYFLALLEGVGVPAQGRAPEFVPRPGIEAEYAAVLNAGGVDPAAPYAVVHPGGNWDLKRWPAESFVRWIRLFRARFPWKIVVIGTPPEEPLAAGIASAFPEGVVSLCGKTSLDTLALLLKGSRFLLSNDSGPIHLAASQGTPILALFGPTSASETGPLSGAAVRVLRKDVGCEVPCYFRSCDHRVCMELLTPEEVFAESERLALETR
jgi:heptosyltransferase-2